MNTTTWTTEAAGAEGGNAEMPVGIENSSASIRRESASGQLELGLRAGPAERPRRVVRTRRYAVARWWFARMRETVRSAQDWDGTGSWRGEGQQEVLALSQAPTRLGERQAA